MSKLCLVLAVLGLAGGFVEGLSISRPFPTPPSNPFLAAHLERAGYYNRDNYDAKYQKNFYRGEFMAPVRSSREGDAQAKIISQHQNLRSDGVYEYVYQTENGIRGQERGIPKQLPLGEQSENVEGSYAYTSPEGLQVLVEYNANEDGFLPQLSYRGVGADKLNSSPEAASVILTRKS